jgi:hypothetical protein
MLRANITDALRFWEPMRVVYNLVLLAVVVFTVGPQTLAQIPVNALTLNVLGAVGFMALLANILYCAAYPVDLFVQASDWREGWRTARLGLWLIGTLTAAWITFNICGGAGEALTFLKHD